MPGATRDRAAAERDVPLELRLGIADLYCDYADALDDDRLERWPEFFTDPCLYKVTARENRELGLPLGLITCESRAMLHDRVVALRETAMVVPRTFRHFITNIRVRELAAGGTRVRANFSIHQTMPNQPTTLFLSGWYEDLVVAHGGRLLFAEKVCIYDSTVVPTSLVMPI